VSSSGASFGGSPGRGTGGTVGGRGRSGVDRSFVAAGVSTAPARTLETVRDAIVACTSCPRLRDYCGRIAREKKAAHRHDDYWGRPVPGFGDPAARLLVVGLAPAAHGANRTGRVFTGDGSGDFLMRALFENGFANIPTARRADDGLALRDAYILSAVRCAPPDNKPAPEEIVRCRVHLAAEIAALPNVQVVIALGKIGARRRPATGR
jgi:uracil-DNA glycosylase family 4